MIESMNPEKEKRPEREERAAEAYGGSEDFLIYNRPDEKPYYDKEDHHERSTYWQPNHEKHKEEPGQ